MPELRLAILLLPPMPPGALAEGDMPFLAHLAAEGTALPVTPESLGVTRQCLLAPTEEESGARISGFEWRSERRVTRLDCALLADWIPRRAFFRPFRRWVGRRWQGFSLSVDPAFLPAASLAHLEPVPVIDPEENLFSDLDTLGVSSTCSLLDYPWLSTHADNYTWIDGVHQRDYMAWMLAALASRNHVVYLELGHRLARAEARSLLSSGRVLRLVGKLDRQLERLVGPGSKSRRRQLLVISPETSGSVKRRVDLAWELEKEHFQVGTHYVAVIHPTFVQLWSTDRQSRDLLESCVTRLPGVSLRKPWQLDRSPGNQNRRWGDWLAVAERGVIFHPNHFDGRTPRCTGSGWADLPAPEERGFVLFHAGEWALPDALPSTAEVDFVRRVLVDTLERRF